MEEIWRLAPGVTRSVSPENFTGAKGGGGRATTGTGASAARELGPGWKVSPSIDLPAGATATLADLDGPGVIRHFWLTTDLGRLRALVLRVYWDDDRRPAIDVPLGDFFCNGWDELALIDSATVAVLPAGGLNSYWPMPFRRRARVTLANAGDSAVPVYYQITFQRLELPDEAAYLHAAWRRSAPVGETGVHTILDGVRGRGHYAGTYLAIRPQAPHWWGEGEVKFFLDGDGEFPTICGTGTEDYFGGAWNFDLGGRYGSCSTRYLGLPQVLPPEEVYRPRQRFGLYRWHLPDPITFARDLRVTIQALGWRSGGRYRVLTGAELATTAFWYQHPEAR